MTKFIMVMGGVISGVGKGITTSSLGRILKEYGYNTTLIKIDPYINYDAGTLRPTEHGEVWVTDDGGEIDQDLGNYERFMNQDMPKKNNMTTGQIFKTVIDRERQGGYLGATVQFIPHIPQEIVRRIKLAADGYDIAIIEIGGTVGDIENIPFLFAAKTVEQELGHESVAYVLVTYLPIPANVGEMKTKPTQQAIKMLREEGIFPDFVVCRAEQVVDQVRKKKIAASSFVLIEHIVSAPDVDSIYQVPSYLEREELGIKLLKRLHLPVRKQPDWVLWNSLVQKMIAPKEIISLAIIGKYVTLGDYTITDSYLSIEQALKHAGAASDVGINVMWIDSQELETNRMLLHSLSSYDGIIVPGGFGAAGVEGKIAAISHARTNQIPYLGICYGMQLACVEYARSVGGLHAAHTTEVDPETPCPVIDILANQRQALAGSQYGGSMSLGAYPAILKEATRVCKLYEETGRLQEDAPKVAQYAQEHAIIFDKHDKVVLERHRHRYEVNPIYVSQLEEKGLVFSGYYQRPDGTNLMEFIELAGHPFFVATQAHPEFKSRLESPSPLFYGLVQAAKLRLNQRK